MFVNYQSLEDAGVLFVSNNTAFTLPYLKLCYLRLMRCKSSPGQEIAVRQLYHEKDSMQLRSESMFRAFLLRGLEAYITLKRNQGIVPEFNYDQPSKYSEKIGSDGSMLFKVPEQVKLTSFDGHFGVHRKLVDKVDGPRTVRVSGHPKSFANMRERLRALGRIPCTMHYHKGLLDGNLLSIPSHAKC